MMRLSNIFDARLRQRQYKYLIVCLNGDPATTGLASRVSAISAEMTKDGSRLLVVRFVPKLHHGRSWKTNWQRTDLVDLLEVPALPISRYAILRKASVALCTIALKAIVAFFKPEVVQCECHEAASLGCGLNFDGTLYADIHGAAPEEAKYARLAMGNKDMAMVSWLSKVESQMADRFDKIIVVSPKMISHIERKHGISISTKASVLPIFPDRTFFEPVDKEKWKINLGLTENIVFVYSGGMQPYQCVDQVIYWFKLIRSHLQNAKLLIFTADTDVARRKIDDQAKELMGSIKIMSVPKSDLANYISAADFGFVLREHNIINSVSSPTKTVEYLSRGVNVICTSDAGNTIDYINRFGCGLVVPLVPTHEDVNRMIDEIKVLHGINIPLEDVHAHLSQDAYAETINKLYRGSCRKSDVSIQGNRSCPMTP